MCLYRFENLNLVEIEIFVHDEFTVAQSFKQQNVLEIFDESQK